MNYIRPAAIAASTIALGTTSALAGGMAEPVEMAPVEIIEDVAGGSSAGGLIVPLILIALIAAAVGSGSDSSDPTPLAFN